jgi:hypothetical protein
VTVDDTIKSIKPWVMFAGGVLVVAVLYWAQAIFVPFAFALLLTFVLTPPVEWPQRWIGRIPAVVLVVTLVFAALGLVGWGLTWQMSHLVEDLPGYRANSRVDPGRGREHPPSRRDCATRDARLLLAPCTARAAGKRDFEDCLLNRSIVLKTLTHLRSS